MAERLTQLRILVSGPSDTEAEKGALKAVVADLGAILEKSKHITLRLVSWPDAIRPGVGADPQSVINPQIGQCDIFIGLLGARFGTPTPRTGSGTEEEFLDALKRFRTDTTSVRLHFYFGRSPQDPFSLDAEQLAKVQEFRESLSSHGVLYATFADTADFTSTARRHLEHLIENEWSGERWTQVSLGPDATPADVQSKQVAESRLEEDDDIGLLDLLDALENLAEELVPVLLSIGEQTRAIGVLFRARNDQINKLIASADGEQVARAQTKSIVNAAAEDLNKYAAAISLDLERFKARNRAMFEALERILTEQQRLAGAADQTARDKAALSMLLENLTKSRDSLTSFQRSLSQMPGLTTELKRARKRASTVVGELVAELQVGAEKSQQIIAKLDLESDSL
jgi:hypothetical protein